MGDLVDNVKFRRRDNYPFEWRVNDEGDLKPYWIDPETTREHEGSWCPQYGSQMAFLSVNPNHVFEVLYEGTRGPGKTDTLLVDFLRYVGRGYGAEWRGILFRQTFPQLGDVITKSKKLYRQIMPGAKYNASDHVWTFPDGEQLLLAHMLNEDDYWKYHGHAYPWIGWEELCTWPDDRCYKVMMSCSRSAVPGIPRCYRSTANPYGPGHNWVRKRFQLPQSRGRVIRDDYTDGHLAPPRLAIHGALHENIVLLHADPDYIGRIRAAARNPSELAAWIEGSWDILAGGMFDDIWRGEVHAVPSFPIHMIPRGWKIDRSFDWGSSKPFSVCWWAESNGEPFVWNNRSYGTVRGDLYMVQEWYGWDGRERNVGVRMLATDIATGIRDREDDWNLSGRVRPGPADSSIFDEENGVSIARDMERRGVRWLPADKGPGSRKQGWEQIRKRLSGSLPPKLGGPREEPGLYILDWCKQALELLPRMQRSDKDLDDVNTDTEDHIGDAVRYRVRKKLRGAQQNPR